MTQGGRVSGKRAIVTGGATGIGAAVVAGFLHEGAQVSFLDINSAAGHAHAAALGPEVCFYEQDLTDLETLPRTLERIIDAMGGIDILVNGAANDDRHVLADVSPAAWRKTLAVNLDHQFFCAQAVLPHLRRQRAGVILNFGSIAWRVGLQDAVGYVTAKAAIEGMTHALAREAGADNVRVNCLLPGFVRTARQVEKWLTPEAEAHILANQCLPGFIEPEEIADVAVFLTSDAARAITNQTIVVDAGWS